jgi:N4-gp56 family major capsid protein
MAALITNLVTNVTAPVNFQLMKGLLKAARKRLPYFNGTLQGQLSENAGAYSVRWERIENLTAKTTALAEPTGNATFFNGRDAVNPTVTRVDAAMAKYGNAITLTEEVDLVQVNARAMRFLETLGANAGESLNELMQADVISGATTVRYAGGAASAGAIGAALVASDIKYAVNQLNRLSAMKMFPEGVGSTNIGSSPIRESYFGICHPDVEEDIRDISGFIAVEQYAGYTSTFAGEFGTVGGVRFSATEIGNITADAGITSANGLRGTSTVLHDVYDTLIYGMEAIGTVGLGENHAKEIYQMGDRVPAISLINHAPGTSGVGDPFNEVGSLAWKAFYAGKVLNTDWIVNVQTAASSL